MTVLKAKIGGQWVPIGGDSDYARWNSSWGVVAIGRFSGNINVGAGAVDVQLTDNMPFTPLVGRQYRMNATIRAITSTTAGSHNMKLRTGTTIIPDTASPWLWTPTPPNYGFFTYAWTFNGDGVAKSYNIAISSGGSAATVYGADTQSYFNLEDVGPVTGAVPIPNPTPAWITPTLLTPWTQRPSEPVQYRKVGDMVQLRGNPQGQAGYTVFYLPVGYRPPSYTRFSTISFATSEATASRGDISNSTGAVLPSVPNTSNAIWQLDGIQFSVTP